MRVIRCVVAVVLICGVGISAATAADIGAIYQSRCAFCHGIDGKGNGPAGSSLKPPPTNFAASDYWKSAQPEAMKTIIAKGKPGTAMIAFGDTMKPDEIGAMIDHLRTFAAH